MGYFGRELTRLLSGQAGDIVGGYNITNLNGQQMHIDGVTKLLSVGADSVRLLAGKCIIMVSGERLTIVESSLDSVVIGGKITATAVEGL